MIDWLTLRIARRSLAAEVLQALDYRQSTLLMLSPDGEVEWSRSARVSIRSDSHRLTIDLTPEYLYLMGSPARLNNGGNVFGSGDSLWCGQSMINALTLVLGVGLPSARLWQCRRMDVTHNYCLPSSGDVKAALQVLSLAEGGRYQVQTHSDTVYWSQRSRYRKGKAYAKGEHLRLMARTEKALVTDEQLELADRLLRLEMTLGPRYWTRVAKQRWTDHSEAELNALHADYFGNLIGKVEVEEMDNLEDTLILAAEQLGMSRGSGKAAHGFWLLVQSYGYTVAKDRTSRTTFYRHMKVLKAAGISYADLKNRKIVPFRRRTIELGAPVTSWEHLRQVA